MKERIIWIDNVRVTACFLVVLLHVSAFHLYAIKEVNSLQWITANIIQSFTRVCVPLFFMISGFLFMKNKEVKIKNTIKIISNLFLYSCIYFIYVYFFRDSVISKLPITDALASTIHKPIFFHLWFFYQLLVCYVFFVFISIKDVSAKKIILSASIIFFFFNAKTSYFTSQLFGFEWNGILSLNDDIPFYILYAALGAAIGKTDVNKKMKNTYLLGYIVLSLFTAYLTYASSMERGRLSQAFYFYSSFLVMLSSLLLFTYLKCISNAIVGKLTLVISGVSLPIYGLHPLILEIFITNNYRIKNVIADIVVFTTLSLVISMLIGLIINKIDRKNILS